MCPHFRIYYEYLYLWGSTTLIIYAISYDVSPSFCHEENERLWRLFRARVYMVKREFMHQPEILLYCLQPVSLSFFYHYFLSRYCNTIRNKMDICVWIYHTDNYFFRPTPNVFTPCPVITKTKEGGWKKNNISQLPYRQTWLTWQWSRRWWQRWLPRRGEWKGWRIEYVFSLSSVEVNCSNSLPVVVS